MKERFLALDTETGGIGADKSLLSAYFLILDENFVEIDDLLLLMKPDDGVYHVTGQALDINGIDLKTHDKTAVTYKEAGTKLYDFLTKNNPLGTNKFIPVGHNVGFDIKFLMGKVISEGSWNKYVSYRLMDTGVIAQFLRKIKIIPTTVNGSLGSLAEHFQVRKHNLHTADGDVRTTVDVLKRMIEETSSYSKDYQTGVSIG